MAAAWLERARVDIVSGHASAAQSALARADQADAGSQSTSLRRLAHSALDPQTCHLRWQLHFGDAHKALQAINAEWVQARSAQWTLRCISLELLRAAALSRCHQESKALEQLLTTLEFAAEQGLYSRVTDEGPLVMQLVEKLQTRENQRGQSPWLTPYVADLKHATNDATTATATVAPTQSVKPSQGLSSPLTPKETQTLELLTEGYSNQALARQLQVSESTVRTHLRNINAKLDVNSRMQAVAKARQLGLLK
jgi:LuxR family maltose regulon positive regulatory protein